MPDPRTILAGFRIHADGKPRFFRFGIEHQVMFVKRLSLYLRAGTPILEALARLEDDARTPSSAFLFRALKTNVMHGQSLSHGLKPFTKEIGELSISLIRIGESSGTLRETLEQLADSLKKRKVLRQKILGALIYPCVILSATLCITVFLALYAFPKIVPLFRGFHAALPFTTRTLIFMTDSVASHGLALLMLSIILMLILWRVGNIPLIRRKRDRVLLSIPLLGPLLRAYHLAVLSQTLGTLLKSGVHLLPSLELIARVSRNTKYREALDIAQARIAHGTRLADSLGQQDICFPRIFRQMVATGESTGTLALSLIALAEHYDEELAEMNQRMTALIEPLLMILMGLMVGFVALAIITPVYRITQDLSL